MKKTTKKHLSSMLMNAFCVEGTDHQKITAQYTFLTDTQKKYIYEAMAEAYNRGLKDAAENATVIHDPDNPEIVAVDVKSIEMLMIE